MDQPPENTNLFRNVDMKKDKHFMVVKRSAESLELSNIDMGIMNEKLNNIEQNKNQLPTSF